MRTILTILSLLCALSSYATDANIPQSGNSPLWLRKSAISPDGSQIAFAYQGDIFVVSSKGGDARQLSSNPAYESDPLWSTDGKYVIFSSLREGSKDIFVTSTSGGSPRRLTNYSGSETPLAVLKSGEVLFKANIQVDPSYIGFPNQAQLYLIPFEGGRIQHVSSLPIMALSVNADGSVIYEDYKGVEDELRKHHTSAVTRDIWLYNANPASCKANPASSAKASRANSSSPSKQVLSINADGNFTQLSDFKGEDRNPVFAGDGDNYYFLSERAGSYNIFKSSLSVPTKVTEISHFDTHPVRYLSVSDDGLLCFSYDGELYTMREGEEAKKLAINIARDPVEKAVSYTSVALGISGMAVSPNGKEVAIVCRGDVFVSAVEAGVTKRVTNTPVQERGVSFGADGRTLYYASERDGHWGVYAASLADKEDKFFSLAYKFEEKLFSEKGQTCFAPQVSPDGKWVAMLRDRTELVIKDVKTGKEKSLIKGVNYSYGDGDIEFEWAPDSKHILSTWQAKGGWRYEDIALVDIENGEVVNLTESGYTDYNFSWGMGGKAMTWCSDRAGYRSHGGSSSQKDIYLMFFDDKAFAEYKRSNTEEQIAKMLASGEKKPAKKTENKTAKDSAKVEIKKLELELSGRHDRILRVTNTSGSVGAAYLNPEGTKLYYVSGGDLYVRDVRKGDSKVLCKGIGGAMQISKDGKYAFFATRLGVSRVDLSGGSKKSISFRGDYDYKPSEERAYIFEHCWKQVNEKFYDPAIHGIDWEMYHDAYAKFLPYIANNYDFRDMLSEMLGELNGSHTGARYRPTGGLSTGRLGILWDTSYEDDGLLIKEVLKGGVMAVNHPEIKAGDIIMAIDGEAIVAGEPWLDMLRSKSGKRVQLTIKQNKKQSEIYLTLSGTEANELYRRWVSRNESIVEELSGGKVGYVHVKGMNSESFREVFSKALGKYRACSALIVDTRHNGGGWLHDDLVTFLSGKEYLRYEPRGQYAASDPLNKWTKPSCVLISEDNYSDASGFPYIYQALGIGKLIGAPVPGTMTAVWWETQIDPTLVFGIPQVGTYVDAEGRYLENLQVEPDIEVYNDPASVLSGRDLQLERAVAEMLKEIGQ